MDDFHLSEPLFGIPVGYAFPKNKPRSKELKAVVDNFGWMLDLGYFNLYDKKLFNGKLYLSARIFTSQEQKGTPIYALFEANFIFFSTTVEMLQVT